MSDSARETIRMWEATAETSDSTLSVYPAASPTGAAMVIFPGGGYQALAPHEGEAVALWLNGLGITGFVVKYRLAPKHRHPDMLNDAARAVRTVRARAREWGVDTNRIGVMGFSAGGHLASTISTHFDAGNAASDDPIEWASSRPDLSVLAYPVISMDVQAHSGSRGNLLGENPPRELVEFLSSHKQVTTETPPTFLFHTADDGAVPVANALMYADALAAAGVAFELHVYEHGRHGVGLATDDPILSTWTRRCADWLARREFAAMPRHAT